MADLSQKLNIGQSQNLVMTPQLQQAIKLLQLNNLELGEFITEELEKNPFLERDASAPSESSNNTQDAPPKDTEDFNDESHAMETYEASPRENQQSQQITGKGGSSNFEENSSSFEDRLTQDLSLRETLMEQLDIASDDPRDRMIGALLIDQLDESGYLRAEHSDLAAQLGCSQERIDRLLLIMKKFEPTGVFAHDLGECLALQLDERGALDQPMRLFLENLDLVAKHEIKKLAQLCGVNETYIYDMIDEIKTLNPKPASLYEHTIVQTLIPDVLMRKLPKNIGGGWRVELNNDTLPRVLINQEYYIEVAQKAGQKSDKEFLKSQLNAANWLVRAMDQRAQTILKVAGAIIEQQEPFFYYGIEYLKPLTLKDIAETTDVHESTVSRVTTNKYIETPRGVFELKFFFSSSISSASASGADLSSEAVKAKIRALIDAEPPQKVLSDDKIVVLLKEQGVDIARRTVSKYREAMNIPSSVQRRRQKRQNAG